MICLFAVAYLNLGIVYTAVGMKLDAEKVDVCFIIIIILLEHPYNFYLLFTLKLLLF